MKSDQMSKEKIAQILAINYVKSNPGLKFDPKDVTNHAHNDKMESIAQTYKQAYESILKNI